MKYMALIYGNDALGSQATPEQMDAVMAAYNVFGEEAHKHGVMVSGEALQPTSTATTVRVREGKTLITDGPFAETKEQLGGFYILDCPTLDEALEWAAKIPGAHTGSIEVRPIVEFN
jgi:hypothetical protein